MNLQETLEAMLDKRRQLVGKLTPAEQSRLLHEGLGNLLEQSLYAQGMLKEEVREQHETLRQLAGCILYLLHPEDEFRPGVTPLTTSHPALPSQAAPHAFTGLFEGEHEVPFTVIRRGDGTYKRKPRPDVDA